MPTSLSPEGRIEAGLRDLECSGRNFVEIARSLNVQISHGPFSEALSGKKAFDAVPAEKLLALLAEFKSVRETYPDVPISWGAPERIATLVVLMRVEKIAAELDRQATV